MGDPSPTGPSPDDGLPACAGNSRDAPSASVSVIIPTRNRRDVLDRAIASVRVQTLTPAEIIVVDDASTDGTADWLRAEHPDARVIVLPKPGGAPSARNIGIDAARGDFVAFLDSDDAYVPEKLERQLGELMTSGADFSTCGFIDSAGRAYCTQAPGNRMWRQNCLGGTTGLVGKREILRKVRFDPDLPAVQDWDLYLRLLRRWRLVHVPLALYRYETGRSDQITRHARRRFLGHAALWRRHVRTASDLSWRTRITHRAGLHMLVCDAQRNRPAALVWRILHRILAGRAG